jgi:hypothetical protein
VTSWERKERRDQELFGESLFMPKQGARKRREISEDGNIAELGY